MKWNILFHSLEVLLSETLMRHCTLKFKKHFDDTVFIFFLSPGPKVNQKCGYSVVFSCNDDENWATQNPCRYYKSVMSTHCVHWKEHKSIVCVGKCSRRWWCVSVCLSVSIINIGPDLPTFQFACSNFHMQSRILCERWNHGLRVIYWKWLRKWWQV